MIVVVEVVVVVSVVVIVVVVVVVVKILAVTRLEHKALSPLHGTCMDFLSQQLQSSILGCSFWKREAP